MKNKSGWFNESRRHALAARGIGTGRNAKLPLAVPHKRSTFEMMMEFEGGNLTREEFVRLFSDLIKSGRAWTLQGFYGRQAQELINAGWIDRKGKINWANVGGNRKEMIYGADSDGDGVPDSEDCSPHNPRQQDYDLRPNDSHKSFYGKARVRREGDRLILRSYDTDVAYIENGRAVVKGRYSNTTARHIRAFLIEQGFDFRDFNDIMKRYGEQSEPRQSRQELHMAEQTAPKPPENWWE